MEFRLFLFRIPDELEPTWISLAYPPKRFIQEVNLFLCMSVWVVEPETFFISTVDHFHSSVTSFRFLKVNEKEGKVKQKVTKRKERK